LIWPFACLLTELTFCWLGDLYSLLAFCLLAGLPVYLLDNILLAGLSVFSPGCLPLA
jgi:hypothetical protein